MNGSDRCHGITQERAIKEGVDIHIVLNEYKNYIDNKCLKLVCHNVNFDVKVVQSELAKQTWILKRLKHSVQLLKR